MTYLVVSFLLLVQPTPDHNFTRAVESFVIDSCPKPIRLTDHVPPVIATKIMQLGDPCWKCRERARSELKAMGDTAVPWLFWGLRHKEDAQIRLSCWTLLIELCSCANCHGTKQCPAYRSASGEWACMGCGFGEYSHSQDTERLCRACNTRPQLLDVSDLRF